MNEDKPKLLTIQGAAAYLGVKVSRIRSAIKRGEVDYIKIGRLVRFEIEDLDRWIRDSRNSNYTDGGVR